MDFLVSPFQASFILGRQSANIVVISQEIFHLMRKLKGKKKKKNDGCEGGS